jgi:chromosome segregation ATPase
MMNLVRALLLRFLPLLPLAGLAACATSTGCDPARAGFMESLNCEQGGYQYRQAVLQQNLAASRAGALEQQAQAARAAGAANAAQRDLAARRREISRLDGRLGEMRGQLATVASRPGVNEAAVRQATAELNDLEHEQKQISHENPADSELRMIEDRQRKVLRELNNL